MRLIIVPRVAVRSRLPNSMLAANVATTALTRRARVNSSIAPATREVPAFVTQRRPQWSLL